MDYPDTLPCVSRIDGYGMNLATAVIRTPFEAGNCRLRRVHAALPHEIALAWRVQNADLDPLIEWLNTYGFDWFNLELAGIEASEAGEQSVPISVRLTSDLQVSLIQFHRANWWNVRATAEYLPPAETVSPDGEELESSMLFVPLHRLTPDPEYGELVYVNLDQALSLSRNVSDTGTRVRGAVVDPTTTAEESPTALTQPATVVVVDGEWTLDAQIAAGPQSGRARLNNAAQAAATVAWLNYTTADGADMKAALAAVKQGAAFALQNKGDATKHASYTVSGAPVDHSTYIELPVTFASGGAALVTGQRTIVQITQDAVPPQPSPGPNLIEVVVKETPEQIAALADTARRTGARIVGAQRTGGAPRTSQAATKPAHINAHT